VHPGFYQIRIAADCLKQREHHVVMGKVGDPTDGAAVAFSIFIAVAVYGVGHCQNFASIHKLTRYLRRLFWYSAVSRRIYIFATAGGDKFHFDEEIAIIRDVRSP
jgi:hypothetical protein